MMVKMCFFNVFFQILQKSIMTAFNHLQQLQKCEYVLVGSSLGEKRRSNHFQWEGGVKGLSITEGGGESKAWGFTDLGGGYFGWGGLLNAKKTKLLNDSFS